MKSLQIVLIVCALLIQSETIDPEDTSMLMLLQKHMQKFDLKMIHFEDPSGVVKVHTVINRYDKPSPKNIVELLKKKVNETAEKLVNGTAQEQKNLTDSAIDVPLPDARQIQSALSG